MKTIRFSAAAIIMILFMMLTTTRASAQGICDNLPVHPIYVFCDALEAPPTTVPPRHRLPTPQPTATKTPWPTVTPTPSRAAPPTPRPAAPPVVYITTSGTDNAFPAIITIKRNGSVFTTLTATGPGQSWSLQTTAGFHSLSVTGHDGAICNGTLSSYIANGRTVYRVRVACI